MKNKFKRSERILILFVLVFINPIISLKIKSQLENNTKVEITDATDTSNLLNNSEIVVKHKSGNDSDKGEMKKVTQKQCNKCTMMKRSIDRILPRRKRFLIYPSASNVVVTMSLVKALTFNTPRGYNLLEEIDFFYPLPDKIYLPHHRTRTTEAPLSTTVAPEVFDHHHHSDYHDDIPTGWDHDHHHDEVFMPPGGWQDDIFKNIDPSGSQMDTMMDTANSSRRYWDEELSYRNSYNNLRPPTFQPQSRRRLDFIKPKQLKSPAYYRKKRSFENKIHKEKIKVDEHTDWPHYKSHRDRRDLYSNIESIFKYKGIHIKTCILRAICEAKHFLLPKGKSLFHDIFRILFTIPTNNEMNDEYSSAARNHDDKENCWKLYETECPISILELLLKSQKIL